jgi:3-oxo-5-alpha-steroid 4-dehydrogenase 1
MLSIVPSWQAWCVVAIFAAAPLTALILLWISAPYGRHGRTGWGPTFPGRLGWVCMELPAVVLFAAVFFTGNQWSQPAVLLLFAAWMFHYVHRTFIFPFRLTSTKPIPVLVAAIAFCFQSANAYANAAWIGELGNYQGWLSDPRLWLGLSLFAVGEAINLQADTVLIHLRAPGETGYKIPYGGAYRWVTNANYLGELIAWLGFAVACWSWAGLAFFVYTAANLVPRAATHHAWYLETFGEDYPSERRRLVPYLW